MAITTTSPLGHPVPGTVRNPAGPALPESPPEVRIRPAQVTADDVLAVGGSALCALCLTWVLFERLLPLSGTVGFWLCCYVLFLAVYSTVVLSREGRGVALADRVMSVICHAAGLTVVTILSLIIGYTAFRGYTALHLNFFTQTMSVTAPSDPLTSGGALHAIVGTLLQVGVAVLISVPLGITTALFLNEVRGPLTRPVRTIVDTMSAIPSVVAGLFVFATVVLSLGTNRCGFAASLAITVMMMPIITRTAEVVLRIVPGGLREASLALGGSQWKTVWHVVLPTARSGLLTAVILGVARGVGETAPVLLTAGFTNDLNADPAHGAMLSLPLYVLNYVKFPQPESVARAYGAALTLLILVLVLFVIARVVGGRNPGALSRRQKRRSAEVS
ncbi:phosphate ABC transporter permease PstA [Frankia sp. Cas4]|uniref:phosphate ABC transporter permease PstA n=1 Tax=Frankia sp. Cas4 TaxID=3073927 RepID=UPI002AD3CBBE|nr:phosphate ABC transporter permease PstA [Frankia sp. Cas4]